MNTINNSPPRRHEGRKEGKMKQLEDFTMKSMTDYIIAKIAEDYAISKSSARKLFINAIGYNVVIEAIEE